MQRTKPILQPKIKRVNIGKGTMKKIKKKLKEKL